jgi:hypothetical protein
MINLMPRPKIQPDVKRQHHIGVRLDESEYGKIRAESEKIGVTFSAYIRSKATRGFIQIPRYAKLNNEHIGQESLAFQNKRCADPSCTCC